MKQYVLPKIPYDYRKIALKRVYESPLLESYPYEGVLSLEAREVYGALKFPSLPENRSYTCGCLVSSVDGKIAYNDDPAGPVIASSNVLDPDGASADFWVLNLFRANMDAVIAGAGTLWKEPDGTNCVMDQSLEQERVARGLSRAPWIVIATLDGTDMRYEDKLLTNQPAMLHSSPAAIEIIEERLELDHFFIGPYENSEEVWRHEEEIRSLFEKHSGSKLPVIITGVASRPDELALLSVLKVLGLERTLIESPSYCHALMRKGLLDEFILNQSGVIVGGDALSIGRWSEAFTSKEHPHTKVVSLHMHSESFFYFRYALFYGLHP